MVDLAHTIAPKSDQLNADDLIGGPRTITVTRVTACPDSAEQPIAVYFEGDGGKPFKPCKSMRRVLVQVWGRDGAAYTGRSMRIYRDPKVQFGGVAVGGIRISHMSHIDADVTMALTATRASRKPYTVKPLPRVAATGNPPAAVEVPPADAEAGEDPVPDIQGTGAGASLMEQAAAIDNALRSAADIDALTAAWNDNKATLKTLKADEPRLFAGLKAVRDDRTKALSDDDDGLGDETLPY